MRLMVVLVVLLAGCAGAPAQDTAEPPVPREMPPPGDVGVLDMALSVTIASEHAPAEVRIDLEIRPQNAIGEPLPATISWEISVAGVVRSGEGLTYGESFTLERGLHFVNATATAQGFQPGHTTTVIAVAPLPLKAHAVLPENATKGEWVSITGEGIDGFADLGLTCQWEGNAHIRDTSDCTTQARWVTDGNQSLTLLVNDGHVNATSTHEIEILPLEPKGVPDGVPADPHVTDDESPAPPHINITHAWFDSDVDHLYVALAVRALPHEAATTESTYRVAFAPSWNATGDAGNFTAFRVTATRAPIDGTALGTQQMHLEGLADEWQDLGAVPGAIANDILWWQVPRTLLQTPWDASISDFLAQAGPSRLPTDVWDRAAGDGNYTLA